MRLYVDGRHLGLMTHGDEGWDLQPMRVHDDEDVQSVIREISKTCDDVARTRPGVDVVVMVAKGEPPTRYEWWGMDAPAAELVRLRHGDGGGR